MHSNSNTRYKGVTSLYLFLNPLYLFSYIFLNFFLLRSKMFLTWPIREYTCGEKNSFWVIHNWNISDFIGFDRQAFSLITRNHYKHRGKHIGYSFVAKRMAIRERQSTVLMKYVIIHYKRNCLAVILLEKAMKLECCVHHHRINLTPLNLQLTIPNHDPI